MNARELDQSDRRLTKLCDLLDTLSPRVFTYDLWVGEDWKGDPDLSCGTTACAGGWATTIPEFRRLGLKLHTRKLSTWTSPRPHVIFQFAGAELEDFDALSRFFRITYWEARYLFSPGMRRPPDSPLWTKLSPGAPSRHAKPKTVALHIRAFMRARRKFYSESRSA